jgi:glycosyltransferase involved in cell wall biosynthesis
MKKNLWYLPLEYLDKRYTQLMDKQLDAAFEEVGIDSVIKVVGEDLTKGVIQTGAFLDSDGTNFFKFSQLQKICQAFQQGKVKNRDVFFVSDLWFPGLIAIPYMAMFHNIDISICGIFHAGSWTTTDYVAQLKNWAHYVEMGWFKMVDAIFVGSEFHKSEILRCNVSDEPNKIFVTGLPFDTKDIVNEHRIELCKHKEDIVVFNSRLDDEKHPEDFDYVADIISMRSPNVQFLKTMTMDLSKDEYFDLLAKSKVVFSAADQENFGYGVLEGIALGNAIVVPDRLSYCEMYPKCFRYDTIDEAVELVWKYLKNPVNMSLIAEQYDKSAIRIANKIQALFF